jgi:single-stranded-DNA-specific exonuclease RecJ
VPGRHGRELEQRAAAARVAVAEVRLLLVPGDLEEVLLHAVVEPGAAKDQFSEPVDERFVTDDRDALPVPHEVGAERAPRVSDVAVSGELDEIARLLLLELAWLHEAELDGGGVDALLEIDGVETEPVAEELHDEVLARDVVGRLAHLCLRITSDPGPSLRVMHEGTWRLPPCPRPEVVALAGELGLTETTASVLVRRGYGDPAKARAFLAAEIPAHDPFLLGDMTAACEAIRATIRNGKGICVHGDYDVDGICATALAVLVLRQLGAEVEWHLPSRFEEGYGVSGETLERLAREDCGLVLTVDCGITAVDEIADARRSGLEVVVTDHHRPGDELPDCPIVATRPSDYPFPELCGTGVVYKLAQALGAEGVDRHLDLVALATVADVVPLVDENRGLVAAGLKLLARTQKAGLRALMQSARVDPATVDAGAVSFRLAPRINAAGRLGHPRAALELLLSEDPKEAERLAAELERLNRDRQAVEERILDEALAQVAQWPESKRSRRGYVVGGEGWHRGVIGIVASRLVERFHRPVVLIAGTDGEWTGSGRSIPAFDLHAALAACSDHLERWGGHRAAAGLSIDERNLDPFADAFAAQAGKVLSDDDLVPVAHVDAAVDGRELTLGLSEELAKLAPFGLGNPAVRLLVGGCEVSALTAVGEGGKHLRVGLKANGRALPGGIAFGRGGELDRLRRPTLYDVVFKLTINRWNGTEAPELRIERVFDTHDQYAALRVRLAHEWSRSPDARSAEARAVFAELGVDDGAAWRSLFESPTFLAALETRVPLAA